MFKICAISDTDIQHYDLKIPKCDIFIFAGDAEIRALDELHMFNDWLGTINTKYCITIAGNHDRYLEIIGQARCEQLFTNATYLQNSGIEINGLKIWGSPYTPEFMSWAFMYPRRSSDAKNIWKQMPENLDILIGHGVPYQILDLSDYQNEHVGCEVLQREIFKKKPKYYLGGHIHESFGHTEKEGINFYNCSVLNGKYQLVNKPTIIEI